MWWHNTQCKFLILITHDEKCHVLCSWRRHSSLLFKKKSICTQTYLGVNCTPTTTHTSSYKHSTAKGIIDKCIRNKININGHAIILGKGSEKKSFRVFWRPGKPIKGNYFTKHHPHRHHRKKRTLLLITKIKKVKWHILWRCDDMGFQHKDTKYLDVRESYLGQNEPNRRIKFG